MSRSDRESRFEAERREVERRESRRLKARQQPPRIWFGLGTFGVIGWSIAAPTVAGALIGLSIDAAVPNRRSWTLMLMLTGLLLGCINVARWMKDQSGEQDNE